MKPVTGWWSILRPVFLLGLGIKGKAGLGARG